MMHGSLAWRTAAAFCCAALAACGQAVPGTAASSGPVQAPSGITSANGGGQRALNNGLGVGQNASGGVTVGGLPNSKGAAY